MFNRIISTLCCIMYFYMVGRFILNNSFGIGKPITIEQTFFTMMVLGAWLFYHIETKGTNSE